MRRSVCALVLWFLLLPGGTFAQNAYYDHGTFPQPGSAGSSAAMRAELDLIEAGFGKLPTLSGNANKPVIVNGSGTALVTTTGTLTLPGNFALSGANTLTLTTTGTTNVTLPTTGTLATMAGSETLTNKTISSPVLSGTATGTYTLGGTPTVSSALTLSSGQLAFPATQNASANVNVLDDYEEGTWTPNVGGNATYFVQNGTYTKIGRTVVFAFYMQINVLGTGSNTSISGLPFTNIGTDTGISVGLFSSLTSNFTSVYGRVNASSTTLGFFGQTAASNANNSTVLLGNSTYISGSGFYFTN